MVTLRGKELFQFYLAVDGKFDNPHRAIVGVYINNDREPLSELDKLVFVEENIVMLTPMCQEVHEQWLEQSGLETPTGTIH